MALTNEELANLLSDDEDLVEENSRVNTLSPELEQKRKDVLSKIEQAQNKLLLSGRKLEELKKEPLTSEQLKDVDRRLDNLIILLDYGRAKVMGREMQGETINSEEKNLEVLKAAADYKAGKLQEDMWTRNQYITEDYMAAQKEMDLLQQNSDEISSHIRK